MTVYQIAKKLHCILNDVDDITSEHLDATIAIGNISLLECDENSVDNIYISISDNLASVFDPGLYGDGFSCKATEEKCQEAEDFLNSLRDKNGELIEWFFADPFLIFIKTVENGYISSIMKDPYDYHQEHRKEYMEWRIQNNKL